MNYQHFLSFLLVLTATAPLIASDAVVAEEMSRKTEREICAGGWPEHPINKFYESIGSSVHDRSGKFVYDMSGKLWKVLHCGTGIFFELLTKDNERLAYFGHSSESFVLNGPRFVTKQDFSDEHCLNIKSVKAIFESEGMTMVSAFIGQDYVEATALYYFCFAEKEGKRYIFVLPRTHVGGSAPRYSSEISSTSGWLSVVSRGPGDFRAISIVSDLLTGEKLSALIQPVDEELVVADSGKVDDN